MPSSIDVHVRWIDHETLAKIRSQHIISDPARCSGSGGARGVGGLTCGLELELQLSDRTGVKT